jgi:hypothetical protein
MKFNDPLGVYGYTFEQYFVRFGQCDGTGKSTDVQLVMCDIDIGHRTSDIG